MRVKSTTKMKIWVVTALLVVSALLILLGNVSKGFQNMNPDEWKLREVNEENLYQAFTIEDDDGYLAKGADGVTVTIDEDNVLKVNGTAEKDLAIMVGTYELTAGTSYVFDSNLENGSGKTVYLRLVNVETDAVVASNYNAATVISGDSISSDITVRLEIFVANEASVDNLSLEVILCEGEKVDDLVKFYA